MMDDGLDPDPAVADNDSSSRAGEDAARAQRRQALPPPGPARWFRCPQTMPDAVSGGRRLCCPDAVSPSCRVKCGRWPWP